MWNRPACWTVLITVWVTPQVYRSLLQVRAHSPYCGVHVAPHTADQTVNTNNRQQPLNKPEAGTKWKKKRKGQVGDEEITATDTEQSCCSLLHTVCYTRYLCNRNLFWHHASPHCHVHTSCGCVWLLNFTIVFDSLMFNTLYVQLMTT